MLRDDPVRRAAVERFIQVLVDLAADVNAHIVVTHLGSAPITTAASFRLAAEFGAIPIELAERLVPAAVRNLPVHRYGNIDVKLLAEAEAEAEAVAQVLAGFDDYVASGSPGSG